jgi:hypothetical protein
MRELGPTEHTEVKRSVCDLVSLLGALFLVACSASAPPGGARGPGSAPGTRVPGTGGSAAPVGPGGSPIDNNFGNPGGLLGSGGSSATPGGAPGPGVMNASVDPNAPMYVADDTAMGGLDPATLTALKTGGAQCTVKVTFPYDNTVFPGGLVPPPIMFDGAADAAYVQFAYQGSDKVDYKFAAKVTAPAQVQIPRPAWDAITRRTNNLPLIVTLNTSSGGVVSSCKLRWKVAAGNMVGAIYYNTYQAPAPGVPGVGAVMRQSLGSEAEIYKQYTGALNPIPGTGPCYSCHSVSFNGSTMVSSFHDYSTQVFRVEKFDVTAAVQPKATGMLDNANFGALTPDGKKILAMGNPQCTAGSDSFPRKPNNFPLVEGAAVARLLDTATGMDLHATGLSKDFYMWMPQFSPDGTKIVFNHAKADASGGSDRFELATMDFNATTNTFSNLKVIVNATKLPGFVAPSIAYSPTPAFAGTLTCGADMCGADGVAGSCMSMMDTPAIPGIPGDVGALPSGSCAGPCYPGWPFFTPDNKAVVFGMTSEPDFTFAFPGRDKPALGELWYVDLETLEVVRLDAANKGLKDVDLRSNYYPTVMPVAVGGYFWVFWTAVRDYGQKVMGLDPSGAPMVAAAEAIKKRIWGAAIKPKTPTVENADLTLVDPSFPGFYVEGQSESGNVRAFAALNPCAANGATCTSGLDCCCGYCTQTDPTIAGACTCEIPMCAKLNEKCTKDSDCCPPATKSDPQLSCLGGFCGFLMLN